MADLMTDKLRPGLLRAVGYGEERAVWSRLLDQVEAYPVGRFQAPMKPPLRGDKPRRLVVVDLEPGSDQYTPGSELSAFCWTEGEHVERVVEDDPAQLCEEFAKRLLTHRTRGALICFWGGAEYGFHQILRSWARLLLDLGYTVQPLAAGASLRALIVRRNRHSWMLCDIGVQTGLAGDDESAFIATFAPRYRQRGDRLLALWSALRAYQRTTLELFGVQLSVTVSRSAMRAAARTIGFNQWLWRPSPLAVAICRSAFAFRGGYASAQLYEGRSYRADMRKAYAAELGAQLPLRSAIGRGGSWPREKPGIYLTRISGPGAISIYIGKWSSSGAGFELCYWNGDQALAFLPTSEYAGLRRLGFRLEAGLGVVFSRTFSFSRYVRHIAELLSGEEPGSPKVVIAKAFGVSVYGKMAENPRRSETMLSLDHPGEDWRPFLTERGDEAPNLWVRETIAHRAHQHVDVAATITAGVRGKLYAAIADILEAGGKVVHADTDGLLSTIDPLGVLPADEGELGDWRLEPSESETAVWGRKAYAYGDDVRVAGLRGITPDDARRLARGQILEVELTQRRGAPWSAPLREQVIRTARSTA